MANRKRIKVAIKSAQLVTSSDKKRAFWINEMNVNLKVEVKCKKPYIKIFGTIKYIKESEIQEYISRKAIIFYE